MKSVQRRSYFWSVFSPNTRKYGPEKTPYLGTSHEVPEPRKRLVVQSTVFALRNRQGKQVFVKENENEKKKEKKILNM